MRSFASAGGYPRDDYAFHKVALLSALAALKTGEFAAHSAELSDGQPNSLFARRFLLSAGGLFQCPAGWFHCGSKTMLFGLNP